MDLLSLLGIVIGAGALLIGHTLGGGNLNAILQPNAALIVLGGTLGATLLSSPKADIARGIRMLSRAFRSHDSPANRMLTQLVRMSAVARKDGIVALENSRDARGLPFLQLAIQHVVDGTNAQHLREILDTDLEVHLEQELAAAKVFETAGGFAPTMGILGAVIGLIHVMENLHDESALGSGIAVAFVATVYGVGIANLLLLPIANKLRTMVHHDRRVREMVMEGALAIQEGQNPRVVEDRLRVFLDEPPRPRPAP